MHFKLTSIQFYFALLWLSTNTCNGQTTEIKNKAVGGPCEGCEAIFEYGDKQLRSTDTLPGFHLQQPKLKIEGTVFKKDGKTPAEDVIIYIYHTNRQGVYEKKGKETGWAKRHGLIRGWVKTGKSGRYTFLTFMPAPYPDGSEPAHIHITVKEPHINEYWLDDYLFDQDPLLSQNTRKKQLQRGGTGIVHPIMKNGIVTVKRDIFLGKNIPAYE